MMAGTSAGDIHMKLGAADVDTWNFTVTDLWNRDVILLNSLGGAVFNELGKDTDFRVEGNTDTHLFFIDGGAENIGIDTSSPTARLHLPAGTATASTAPLKFTEGTLLGTPEAGTIEYDGKFYITNNNKQKAIDRTSDVAVETVTVENTTVETTMWTAEMAANSLEAGNVFKFHADGVVSNGGSASADDQIILRVKINGVEKVKLEPSTKALDGAYWHVDGNACQRTIGENGNRAMHIHLQIDDVDTILIGIMEIDTTANMDITVTAEWGSAKAANTISLYQGFMEYKN